MILDPTKIYQKGIPGFANYFARTDGTVWSSKYRRLHQLKVDRCNKNGRYSVTLRRDGVSYKYQVSHLILFTFIGPCPEGMECCHRNDIKTDNRFSNLYWGTKEDNVKDAIRNNVIKRGIMHPNSKFEEDDIHQIRELWDAGWTQVDIAKLFNTTDRVIFKIVHRLRWKHL